MRAIKKYATIGALLATQTSSHTQHPTNTISITNIPLIIKTKRLRTQRTPRRITSTRRTHTIRHL